MQPQTCSLCGVTEGEALGHSFREATCLAPETCTLCGEIRGEALSHTFREATCLAPETCTLCGMTQGETLIHEYSQWTIAEPDTVRSCSLCGGEETVPIDRESYLKQQLTRFWSVASVQIGGGWINVTSRMPLTDSAVMGYWTTIEGGELCYLHLKEDHTLSGYIGYKDGDVSGNWYAWPAAKRPMEIISRFSSSASKVEKASI